MPKHDFYNEVIRRLQALCAVDAQVGMAISVLQQIVRNAPLGTEPTSPSDGVCIKSAAEIASYLRINKVHVSDILKALEDAGALEKMVEGEERVIRLSRRFMVTEKMSGHRREFLLPRLAPSERLAVKMRLSEPKNYWRDLRAVVKRRVPS